MMRFGAKQRIVGLWSISLISGAREKGAKIDQ